MKEQRMLSASGATLADQPIRVVIPVSVAFDLKRMQTVTSKVLERLGCPSCHSGLDIRFDMIRQFYVDEQLNVRDAPSGFGP